MTKSSEPVMLLVNYATETTLVELEVGEWNLVAPTTGGATSVKSLLESQIGEDDIVIVPQKNGAPLNVRKSGGKLIYDGYRTVGDKKIPASKEVEDEKTIPAGTGFWFISGGTQSINL